MMSIPDMTQRFPQGMYDIYESPARLDITLGDILNEYIEMAKNDECYFYCLVYVIENGKRDEYKKLEEVKRKYANKLYEYLYHTHWHDETIVIEF